jgi:hypothetical protein
LEGPDNDPRNGWTNSPGGEPDVPIRSSLSTRRQPSRCSKATSERAHSVTRERVANGRRVMQSVGDLFPGWSHCPLTDVETSRGRRRWITSGLTLVCWPPPTRPRAQLIRRYQTLIRRPRTRTSGPRTGTRRSRTVPMMRARASRLPNSWQKSDSHAAERHDQPSRLRSLKFIRFSCGRLPPPAQEPERQ